MNLEEALDKIFSMHQFHIKLGLENIEKLLKYIGNPEKRLKAFHIAGSNGKGSTASFIASILMEAGYKVGLYTSPHFVKFNERVRINGEMIPDNYIADFINELDDYIDKEEPTFFEITTALAFKYFSENDIDYAVIEVGLGGRLDATNTLSPLASVITGISFEHTNILGESLEEIALEKAGIIKNNGNLFLGVLDKEAEDAILKKAKSNNNRISLFKDEIRFNDFSVVNIIDGRVNIYSTPLRGKYQIHNASLAVLVVNKTLNSINAEQILNGINNVIENTGIQGRYEVYSKNPKVIFDAAHNEEGINVFLEEFKRENISKGNKNLIFGGMQDKNLGVMLKNLSEVFDYIFISSINYERAAKFSDFKSISIEENIKIEKLDDPARYIQNFINSKTEDTLVVLGSIYLIGDIKLGLIKK